MLILTHLALLGDHPSSNDTSCQAATEGFPNKCSTRQSELRGRMIQLDTKLVLDL